jgi:hypothetical protein
MLPREYLLSRFRTDADTLRQRAESLSSGPPQPGPDAVMSRAMATACNDVVAMVEAIPEQSDAVGMIGTLTALIPLLDVRAAAVKNMPPVRAVYAGAATRIREVADAEARHQHGTAETMRDEGDDDREDDD